MEARHPCDKGVQGRGFNCLLWEAIPVSHGSREEAGQSVLFGRSTVGSTGHDLVWLGIVVGAATQGCLLLPACWRSCRPWSDAPPYVAARGLVSPVIGALIRPHLRCCDARGGQNVRPASELRQSGRYPSWCWGPRLS